MLKFNIKLIDTDEMLKTIIEKISKFAALHPQAMMYGISLGATLGIALAVSFAMDPHDALAWPREPGRRLP
jgi:hypothetical protein